MCAKRFGVQYRTGRVREPLYPYRVRSVTFRQHRCQIKNAAERKSAAYFICQSNQMARSTLLERRHLVQAYTWQGVPFTTALTRFTLGFHSRLERLWEGETLIPKVTPLPQKSHFAIHCTSHPKAYSYAAPIGTLRYDNRLSTKMQAFFCKFFRISKKC